MSTQPEALELAERLSRYSLGSGYAWHCHKAAALLRTQHADLERKDALLRQALAMTEEAQTYTGCATWSPSMTNELKSLCLAITKELAK